MHPACRPVRPYLGRLPLWSETSSTPDAATSSPQVRNPRVARLEAVLFAADAPLSSRRLADAATLADATEARTLVRQLNALYDADHSAFRVEQIAGGFQLLTRPEFSRWLTKLYQSRPQERLSRPALETLAIVAYRQPVLRADVETLRAELEKYALPRGKKVKINVKFDPTILGGFKLRWEDNYLDSSEETEREEQIGRASGRERV